MKYEKKKGRNTRDLERSRRLILEAAAKEFAEKGLAATKLESIAERAGVSKGLIHYIFGTKDDLHLAVLENFFEQRVDTYKEIIDIDEISLDKFIVLYNQFFDLFMEQKEYASILLHDFSTGFRTFSRLSKKRPDLFEVFAKVFELMSGLTEKGMIREIDVHKGVIMIIVFVFCLASIFPHVDLIFPVGSSAHQNLSDPGQWKDFIAQVVTRTITLENE